MADLGKQIYEQQYLKVWKDIFFAFVRNRTICLLCGYEPSIVKRYNLERHYRIKHAAEYSSYGCQEKLNLLEGLKLVYQEGDYQDTLVSNASHKAVAASYAMIAFLFLLRNILSHLLKVNL